MGFFQLPMLADKGWDRQTFGLAMALQNLFWGLGLPFFGAAADRYGSWRVLASAGCSTQSASADGDSRHPAHPAYRRRRAGRARHRGRLLQHRARRIRPHRPPERRSFVFGIGTAAGSAGMFLFAPISQGLIDAFGWSDTLIYHGNHDAGRCRCSPYRSPGTRPAARPRIGRAEQTIGRRWRGLRHTAASCCSSRASSCAAFSRLHHRPLSGLCPRYRHRSRATPCSPSR